MDIAPPTTDQASNEIVVHVDSDSPEQETDEPKDPDAGKSAEDLLRDHAHYFPSWVNVTGYTLNQQHMDLCTNCNDQRRISGELRLITADVHMRTAHVCQSCESEFDASPFENDVLSPADEKRKVQMVLAGANVCD